MHQVTIVPFQPEEVLSYTLACVDVGVVSFAAGAEGVSMPSKTCFTMAAETHYSHAVCIPQMLEALQEVMGA